MLPPTPTTWVWSMVSVYRPSGNEKMPLPPTPLTGLAPDDKKVNVTTLPTCAAARLTLPVMPPCSAPGPAGGALSRCTWNALAIAPVKVTASENVTVSESIIDRWIVPSSILRLVTVGGGPTITFVPKDPIEYG